MAKVLFGQRLDAALKHLKMALAQYEADHPGARAELYRHSEVSVRIRVLDPSFESLTFSDRGERVWPYLRKLPDEVQDDISILLLLTPKEAKKNELMNLEFDHPMPTSL